mmetsp:Transcript_5518/g.20733  ORF Transcript_5518/g.20733 Transcript_5518/m.20733 type:complete len:218 (-) Transcript_5518:879-1532(-)
MSKSSELLVHHANNLRALIVDNLHALFVKENWNSFSSLSEHLVDFWNVRFLAHCVCGVFTFVGGFLWFECPSLIAVTNRVHFVNTDDLLQSQQCTCHHDSVTPRTIVSNIQVVAILCGRVVAIFRDLLSELRLRAFECSLHISLLKVRSIVRETITIVWQIEMLWSTSTWNNLARVKMRKAIVIVPTVAVKVNSILHECIQLSEVVAQIVIVLNLLF